MDFVYVLTQYGQVYGTYTDAAVLAGDVRSNLPHHVWGEYRVTRYSNNEFAASFFITPLKEFMQ